MDADADAADDAVEGQEKRARKELQWRQQGEETENQQQLKRVGNGKRERERQLWLTASSCL